MRLFFLGPRVLGVRPGISLGPRDFQKLSAGFRTGGKTSSATGGFVYVLKDESGRHKIGSSRDPITRVAQLQTGSAERLDFAYIGVSPEWSYVAIERSAHALLQNQKIPNVGDEWFRVPASIAIGAVIEASGRLSAPIQQVSPIMVPQILAIVAQQQAKESMPGKYCGIFNPLPWYLRWPLALICGLVASLILTFLGIILVAIATGGH